MAKANKSAKTTLLVKKFDVDLRVAMKIEALKADKTLHDWVIEALRAAVEKAKTGS